MGSVYFGWRRRRAVSIVSDLWSRGHGFEYRPGWRCKSFLHLCTSVTKQYKLVLAYRRWRLAAGKVTAGLAESNGSLPPGLWHACVCVCVTVGLVGGGGSPPPGSWLCMLSPAGWLPSTGSAPVPYTRPTFTFTSAVIGYCIMNVYELQNIYTVRRIRNSLGRLT